MFNLYNTHAQLRIEYSLKVSQQLQGNLDYLLHSQNHFLVIEAKNEDLVNGFTQLSASIILNLVMETLKLCKL